MQNVAQLWQAGYTPSVPFKVNLPDGSLIVCEEVVRAMPGRRYVCKGHWGERTVFIKLFANSQRAEREWRNEQQGIDSLHQAAIPAPSLLLSTQLPDNATHVLVYAELELADCSRERWEREGDAGRQQMLEEMVDLLARHHAAGIRQRDLHMRNFLYSDSVLYTLDAADFEISPGALDTKDSLKNLAALLALPGTEYDRWLPELYARYCQQRGWQLPDVDEVGFLSEVHRQRRYKQNKFLKKAFHNCTAFVASKTWRRFHVYDRREDQGLFRELVANPDSLPVTAHRSILKAGNTCTVTSLQFESRKLVCKRYNIKNILHRLGRAFRPSRASQSWRNAHRLLMYGIATARPLALIENRFGPLRGTAWFIMQAVAGPNAREYFQDPAVSRAEQFAVAGQFAQMLGIMHREQISHGDMKASNFVISDGRLVVLDLDALRQHRYKAGFERAFRRDLRRFFRNWAELPELAALFRERFLAAGLQDYLPGA